MFGEVAPNQLRAVWLTAVPLKIALPSRFAEGNEPLTWSALSQMAWIYTSYYCPFQNMMDQLFAAQGLAVPHKVVSNDEQTRLDLVTAGVGGSLLLAADCEAAAEAGKLCLFPFETEESLVIDLQLIYPAVRGDDPLLKPVIEAIKSIWLGER